MKVSPKDLARLIREIVQDELRKSIKGVVQECLTESYLKKIVAESKGRAPVHRTPTLEQRLSETFAEDVDPEQEDKIPGEDYEERNQGIYQKSPLVKGDGDGIDEKEKLKERIRNENVSKLLSKSNPMSFIFEGTRPISEDAPRPGEVKIDKLAAAGLNFGAMSKLAGIDKKPELQVDEAKLKDLERRRAMLDGGKRPQKQAAPAPVQQQVRSSPLFDPSVAEFPSGPVRFDSE